MAKVCHSIGQNCQILQQTIEMGKLCVIDIMKWNYDFSFDLEGFAGQLPRLERATKWLTDSYSAEFSRDLDFC